MRWLLFYIGNSTFISGSKISSNTSSVSAVNIRVVMLYGSLPLGESSRFRVNVKALAGCGSDEVPGIKGIGEITACKYLKNQLKETTAAYKKIVDGKEEATKRNIPLVKLPFDGTPVCKLVEDKFDAEATKELFEYFEFDSFLDEFDEWEELLK